jgi:cytochrome c5
MHGAACLISREEEDIMKSLWSIAAFVFFLAVSFVCAASAEEARSLFEKKCSACHGIDRPKSKAKTPAEWRSTVLRMKSNGAAINDDQVRIIVEYLATNYPKK